MAARSDNKVKIIPQHTACPTDSVCSPNEIFILQNGASYPEENFAGLECVPLAFQTPGILPTSRTTAIYVLQNCPCQHAAAVKL